MGHGCPFLRCNHARDHRTIGTHRNTTGRPHRATPGTGMVRHRHGRRDSREIGLQRPGVVPPGKGPSGETHLRTRDREGVDDLPRGIDAHQVEGAAAPNTASIAAFRAEGNKCVYRFRISSVVCPTNESMIRWSIPFRRSSSTKLCLSTCQPRSLSHLEFARTRFR